MGTSHTGGVIAYAAADLAADEPLDTVMVRDEVFGSALHKADQAAQVRASWTAIADALVATPEYLTVRDRSGTLIAEPVFLANRWYSFPLRPTWAPKVRTDGTGYRLRVQLAGCSSAGHRVDFRVAIGPRGIQAPDTLVTGGRLVVADASNITATTPAALALDSGNAWIDVPVSVIAAASEAHGSWSTLTDIGGTPITADVPMLEALVLGRTYNAGSEPRLYAFHVAEYIGP